MITRPYLLSTTWRRSSIGGLMIPSLAGVHATRCLPEQRNGLYRATMLPSGSGRAGRARTRQCRVSVHQLGHHQGYQLAAYIIDSGVDQGDIELAAGLELGPGGGEPPGDDVGGLGLPPGEPPDQLVPGRRCQEHQQRSWQRRPDLPRALDVDLQQCRDPGLEPLLDGRPRGAVLIPRELGPFEQLSVGRHCVKITLADEVILAAVSLARPGRPGRDGYRLPNLRLLLPQSRDNGALADAGGPGQHGQMNRNRDPVSGPARSGRASGSRTYRGQLLPAPVHQVDAESDVLEL